jgi:glucans biosynthesis protein C
MERALAAETRWHALDGIRALAILLVISAHGLMSFMETPIGWAIQDGSRHLAVDGFIWVVRGFIMPVFFWVSGFFARATVEKIGLGGFSRQRLQRVLIPFLLVLIPTSLALNALWDWARELAGGRADVSASLPLLRASELPITLGHLWYLYYLLVMSGGAALLVLGQRLLARRALPRRPWPPVRGSLIPVLLVVPVAALLAAAGKLHLDTPLSFLVDPTIAVYYGLFFAWGWKIHGQKEDLSIYARHPWLYLTAALALLIVIVPALLQSTGDTALATPPPGALIASAAFTCFTTAAFIGFCCRHVRRHHPWVRLVSDASYWSYVVHLPLVVFLQILLATVSWPGGLEFAAILACALVFCLVTYRYLIQRTPLRRFFG